MKTKLKQNQNLKSMLRDFFDYSFGRFGSKFIFGFSFRPCFPFQFLRNFHFNHYRSLYFFIFLFIQNNCKTFEKENLIYKTDSFVIYEIFPNSKETYSSEILVPIFLEIFKTKEKKERIISDESLEKISTQIKNKSNYLILIKKEDTISPYTRFLRTSFEIDLRNEKIFIHFFEIEKSFNIGTNFEFRDWAILQDSEKICKKTPSFYFDKNGIQYKKTANCEKNYSSIEIDKEKFFSNPVAKEIKPSPDLRLEKLKLLFKKGLISKEDYELKKAEILGEL